MLFTLVQLCLFVAIVYQDFKSREVSVFVLLLLGGISMVKSLVQNGLEVSAKFFGVNLLVLIVLFACVNLYFWVKHQKVFSVFDRLIGWGDIVLFVTLCILFSPINFLLLFIGSLAFSLIAALGMHYRKPENTLIPLAGFIAVFFITVFLFFELTGGSVYSDEALLSIIQTYYTTG